MTELVVRHSCADRSLMASQSRPCRVRSVRQWVGLAVVAMMFFGCGSSKYELETAPVSGSVTLDGKPLVAGYVFIVPSKGRMAKGAIQPDGTFVMSTYQSGDGVPVGNHAVFVSPVPPDEANGQQNKVAIPAKYSSANSSGLSVDVKPGEENNLELALTSKK